MWAKIKDGIIEDLHFTISLTRNCNLHCAYCPLDHKNETISTGIVDDYIQFFWKNEALFRGACKNIVIIFFGGEPLLESDKIEQFLEWMQWYGVNLKYVIYSNGTLISEAFLQKLDTFNKKKIIFYISIDGDEARMLENRLPNAILFQKIIKTLKIHKKTMIVSHKIAYFL